MNVDNKPHLLVLRKYREQGLYCHSIVPPAVLPLGIETGAGAVPLDTMALESAQCAAFAKQLQRASNQDEADCGRFLGAKTRTQWVVADMTDEKLQDITTGLEEGGNMHPVGLEDTHQMDIVRLHDMEGLSERGVTSPLELDVCLEHRRLKTHWS